MILTQVTLKDYGVYRGRNVFDLAATEDRPVVLIGGTNGAGKTTLFESVMLCLYGISVMKKRATKKSYEEFLARKIHRYSGGPAKADGASVAVQFRFFHGGRETEYRVERSWAWEDGSVAERLDVSKRAPGGGAFSALDTVERSYWQSFIDDLIPSGIVRLFFFDGEKIVDMAREGSEDEAIRESFKSLLGIEVVEQLRTDLQVSLARSVGRDGKELQEKFDALKAEKGEIATSVARLREKAARCRTDLDSVQGEIASAEARLAKVGGEFAAGREEAKQKLAALEAARDAARQRLEEMCAGALPFSIIPGPLEALSAQIREEGAARERRAGLEVLGGLVSKLAEQDGGPWRGAGADPEAGRAAAAALESMIRDELSAKGAQAPVLDLSPGQAARMSAMIEDAGGRALRDLRRHTEELARASEEAARLEASIASAPRDDEIGPMVSRIGELHSRAGEIKADIDHMESKMSSNAALSHHMDAQLRGLVEQMYKRGRLQQSARLIHSVQEVLDEFVERLKAEKIRLLERYLLDAAGTLMHKRRLIGGVSVDPETFEVSLSGRDGRPLPKDTLSEGEKQMLAMAILWALARASGRPLPFMVDTPLARLDEEHRANIVERFLPAASHQILVFSTDTEIGQKEHARLGPHLSRSYAMGYDEEGGFTSVSEGYFWDAEGNRVAAV